MQLSYSSAAGECAEGERAGAGNYAWLVFALTFGLLLSDYMSRQVLNAVFPLLETEWDLSDTQLGTLSGVVSLAVGALALPLSLLADRWGRLRSLVLMAALWSIATLACGLASSFGQMLVARFFVGVGEAAYGSVGLAILLSVFPVRMRATISGAFLAGSMVGSVLGISVGGLLAAQFGWRAAFAGMALFGLVLTICYPLVVKESHLAVDGRAANSAATATPRPRLRALVSSRSVICAYFGSGVQVFITGALLAWLPSYLHRAYGMTVATAAAVAALFVLSSAAGMAICGSLADRVSRNAPAPKNMPSAISTSCGSPAGTVGPAGAMVANLTPEPLHGTALGMLSLANNLLGLAPGPIVTGMLADMFGLPVALQLVPLVSLISAGIFMLARSRYQQDLQQLGWRVGAA